MAAGDKIIYQSQKNDTSQKITAKHSDHLSKPAGCEKDGNSMATGSFPPEPSSRKAVLVLQQYDIEKCSYERDAAKALLDEETYILPYPINKQTEFPQALQNIIDADLARPGAVLVQSPFDADTYVEVSQATALFALEKHMHFSTLCMHLGAKKVTVEQVKLQTQDETATFKIQAERLGASGQLNVKNDEAKKLIDQMCLEDIFTGGEPNIQAAENLLRRTRLLHDPSMRSLLEMRRDGMNQLVERRLTLSLSSEAKKNLNIVGRLKVPSFVNLSTEVDKINNERNEFTLTVLVEF